MTIHVIAPDATDCPLPPIHHTSSTKRNSRLLLEALCDADFNDFKDSATCIEADEEEDEATSKAMEDVNNSNNNTNKNCLQDDMNTTTCIAPEDVKNKTKYVTPKDFELLSVIGVGAFGRVLQVRNKQSKKIFAMKIISKRLLRRKNSYVKQIQLERDILKRIRHPFIVNMHCSFQTKEKLFIVMDLLAGGELFLRQSKEGIFLEDQAAFYLAEIILALEHLHNHGILHRDLKPENVLLSADGHVCLTDFGLSKDFSLDQQHQHWNEVTAETSTNETTTEEQPLQLYRANTICGTAEYMAPEMIAKKGYGKAADFWSLGCLLYEMLSGRTPFHSKLGEKDILRKILSERIKMPQGTSSNACKVLKGLLNRNPQDRLGAAKSTMFQIGGTAGLKQMEFFSGIHCWSKLDRKEVDPPARFLVDSETDLRHFHDEFTKMDIPFSVIHLAHDNFQPRRCASHHFRGFSFVQEDFELPDRQEDEFDKYWNNIDMDGESHASELSTTAGDDGLTSPSPVKRKRPPRKKNKTPLMDASTSNETNMEGLVVNAMIPLQDRLEQIDMILKNSSEARRSMRHSADDEEEAIATYAMTVEMDQKACMRQETATSLEKKQQPCNTSAGKTPAVYILPPLRQKTTESQAGIPTSAYKPAPFLMRIDSAVYVPPSLRQKKEESQAGSGSVFTSSYKPAPKYVNSSPRTELHTRVESLASNFSTLSLQQQQSQPNNTVYNKPFPGSWAAVKPAAEKPTTTTPLGNKSSIHTKISTAATNDKRVLLQRNPDVAQSALPDQKPQQQQPSSNNNDHLNNKPFPGSWAVPKPAATTTTTTTQQVKNCPLGNNKSSVDTKMSSITAVTSESTIDKRILLYQNPDAAPQKKILEAVSIETYSWPTLGKKSSDVATPKVAPPSSAPTAVVPLNNIQGVWGSKTSGAAVVLKGSAWNKQAR